MRNLTLDIDEKEKIALRILLRSRPSFLREYDQIAMYHTDLLNQVKRMLPLLANKSVAFIGDDDGIFILIGLLHTLCGYPAPTQMTLLDFDMRIIKNADFIAERYSFKHFFQAQLYNVFDSCPKNLCNKFNVFYTNPPYGAYNEGASARLFIARGFELLGSQTGVGYILIPDNSDRPWTQKAFRKTEQFLDESGWKITEKSIDLHHYELDDDPSLMSVLIALEPKKLNSGLMTQTPWTGLSPEQINIPMFYGKTVLPPYPQYIGLDGRVFSWLETSLNIGYNNDKTNLYLDISSKS
jgi:N4-bis(aminopropyl)spermidine synthase